MPAPKWLPSEEAWIDALGESLLDGKIMLVRALPRWGISTACASLAQVLGESAVLVDGRTVTEGNQKVIREQIDADVAAAIDSSGCAQLIFDNYGRAIRRSQGAALHSVLYRLLVDSPTARDTGALLVARYSDVLDLNFSGSPLVSRSEVKVLPELADVDAAFLGVDLEEIRQVAGDLTWLARRFIGVSWREGEVSVQGHLDNDRRRILDAMPSASIEVLEGARSTADLTVLDREALRSLGAFDEEGTFTLASLVAGSRLPDESKVRSPGWPSTLDASVQRFADLLDGVSDAIWVDRYLLASPSYARRFLDQLRTLTSARLSLLISDDRDRPTFASEIRAAIAGTTGVSVRFMHRHDRPALHDRHLVAPALGRGYVLPTAGVILGLDDPGSAVAAPLPSLVFDYEERWRRGATVV